MSTSSSFKEPLPMPPPPWDISTGIAPTPMEALSGEFAIMTHLKGNFLTAVGGGGRTADAIHTDAIQVRGGEKFRLWVDSATRHQYYVWQTSEGHFVTAYNAGGLTADAIRTDAPFIEGWEMFKLLPLAHTPSYAIQTLRGFLLTAVGGGGHGSGDTIHTDAVQVADWERFEFLRSVDFGTGSTYQIQAYDGPVTGGVLTATNGGNLPGGNALTTYGNIPFWMNLTLLKQGDGTYAIQTASGRVVTAIGGGLPGEGFRTDTEASEIGNWEKFTLVDNGDFTAHIKTYAGMYVTVASTYGGDPVTIIPNAAETTRWRFWVVGL
jgi:FtsP/CotA-like multicopper oxidase with cupredoxin domain